MTAELKQYFEHIASLAQSAVDQPRRPPVTDSPQESRATSWSALAVHPLAVLESEYLSIVRKAEAQAGQDVDAVREAGFQALSGFFALSASAPSQLSPQAPPLISERARDLAARFELARALNETQAAETLSEIIGVISDAADMIAAMTSPAELPFAQDGLRQAAEYLGLFRVAPQVAARHWQDNHPNPVPAVCLAELEAQLLRPLLSADNAAACARSLYNIAPFYLYRLMHRFEGGDQATPMDLAAKGMASGAATAALNDPALDWLTRWHEEQVIALKQTLSALNDQLAAQFQTGEQVLRFHLKGGRAMYTALGQPQNGRNDWDTGVLINPGLTPERWYAAYAAVNDVIVRFLDRARFGYTSLLSSHAGDLPPTAGRLSSLPPADLSERAYSREALVADSLEEQHAPARPGARQTGAALMLEARRRVRPAGVNGELIDIGISKRSTVELAEHWAHVQIVECPGESVTNMPVPTLPYFVDDFSTIIREALRNGTADRKLAKRLRRLKLVLDSQDPVLRAAVTSAFERVDRQLSQGARALGAGQAGAAPCLMTWVLDGLLRSVPDGTAGPDWTAALDRYLAAQAARLMQSAELDQIWQLVGPELDPAEQPVCKALLTAQSVASQLAGVLHADARTLSDALGGRWRQSLDKALEAIRALPVTRGDNASFYLSGSRAAWMQARHAGLPADPLLLGGPEAAVEVFYRAAGRDPQQELQALCQRLGMVLAQGAQARFLQLAQGAAVLVEMPAADLALTIKPPNVTLLLIRQEPDGVGPARILDFLENWPVASSRDLTRLFIQRAAQTPDFDLRRSRNLVANYLRDEVLGRQLR